MLIETAKANGLEPFDYLSKVIARCAYAETLEHREDLLPWNIQQQGWVECVGTGIYWRLRKFCR